MLNENSPLKSRLDTFDFDRDVSPAFVARLARENRWTRGYAERVCAEYKRFAFLSLSAGHPCTPSDQVDQAWHLHVLHTASYWEHFCGEVLQSPLHHGPTRGGAAETEKFRALYDKTLQSYRACFSEAPPRDIWPSPAERFAINPVRVDRRRYWLVPKVTDALPTRVSLLAAALATLFAGCEVIGRTSPFELSGDAFLVLFLKVWIASVVLAIVLRRVLPKRARQASLHTYEIAYLADGHVAASDAAVASLVERGHLSVDHASNRFRLARIERPEGHAIEGVIVDQCAEHPDGAPLGTMRRAVGNYGDQLRHDAEAAGLLFTATQSRICLLVALVAPLLGSIRVLAGIMLDKPVGALVILTSIAVIVAFALRGHMHATPAGAAWLERMRADNPLEQNPQGQWQPPPSMPTELAISLFGVGVLVSTPMADMAALFQTQDSGDGGGCGSDGGGGDGDGGCGGCGGCGGGGCD